MDKSRFRPILLGMPLAMLLAGTFCGSTSAQAPSQDADPALKGKVVPPSLRKVPFSLETNRDQPVHSVEFRGLDQMTANDRMLAANAEASISESAGYQGFEFHEGRWNYQQIVCPALPNHIFLRFVRNNGENDVSMFTASIPHGEEGKVRIIPIQRRGYSLFSPAPINALTVSAFNHIRGEENLANATVPDWVGTALCYAALAGGQPKIGGPSESPELEKYPLAVAASMEVPAGGGAILTIPDVGPATRPIEWRMDFDSNGKLLKATREPALLVTGYWYKHPHASGQSAPHVVPNSPAPVGKRIAPSPGAQASTPSDAPRAEGVQPTLVPSAAASSPDAPASLPTQPPGSSPPQHR